MVIQSRSDQIFSLELRVPRALYTGGGKYSRRCIWRCLSYFCLQSRMELAFSLHTISCAVRLLSFDHCSSATHGKWFMGENRDALHTSRHVHRIIFWSCFRSLLVRVVACYMRIGQTYKWLILLIVNVLLLMCFQSLPARFAKYYSTVTHSLSYGIVKGLTCQSFFGLNRFANN